MTLARSRRGWLTHARRVGDDDRVRSARGRFGAVRRTERCSEFGFVLFSSGARLDLRAAARRRLAPFATQLDVGGGRYDQRCLSSNATITRRRALEDRGNRGESYVSFGHRRHEWSRGYSMMRTATAAISVLLSEFARAKNSKRAATHGSHRDDWAASVPFVRLFSRARRTDRDPADGRCALYVRTVLAAAGAPAVCLGDLRRATRKIGLLGHRPRVARTGSSSGRTWHDSRIETAVRFPGLTQVPTPPYLWTTVWPAPFQ